jgi:hypothetical protein
LIGADLTPHVQDVDNINNKKERNGLVNPTFYLLDYIPYYNAYSLFNPALSTVRYYPDSDIQCCEISTNEKCI